MSTNPDEDIDGILDQGRQGEFDIVNVCDFKPACKACKAVTMENRPYNCIQLECPEYTPCPECTNNRPLDPQFNICGPCLTAKRNPDSKETRSRVVFKKKKKEYDSIAVGGVAPAADAAEVYAVKRHYKICRPGTAPAELNDDEKDYYLQRWHEYQVYYRDPTASALIHFIILEEIDMHRIQTMILGTQGEANVTWQKMKAYTMKVLKSLKEDLPDKEARKETDDETSLGIIHQRYLEEKKLRGDGRARQIFSAEAIALAPELPHKLDLKKILARAGFAMEDIEPALEKYILDYGNTPDEILKNLGFKLKERYAMPYDPNKELEDSMVTDMSDSHMD